jgi:catechol 2,3-dioxygenase-like lactoylglutathione lyase family enzyme
MLTGARFGTRDIRRAIVFYDAVAGALGASRVIDRHGLVGYRGPSGALFMIGIPLEGEASVGNGSQVIFEACSRAAVDAAHAKALECGGTCLGLPGPRGGAESKRYGAYFRDLDGNKIMVLHYG